MPVRAGLPLLLALTAAAPMVALVDAPLAGEAFDVSHYRVALGLDVGAGTITGREQIDVVIAATTNELTFDSGALTIDSITSGGAALAYDQNARRLIVTLPVAARTGERRSLDVSYHGAPRNGLTLAAGSSQAYTTFSTSQWMLAVDSPSDRATLDLEVAVPHGWKAAGSGRESARTEGPRTTTYSWRQDRDTASFLFGFVAGTFAEASEAHGRVALRYLGAPFSPDELRRIFRDTPAMLDFFEARAGVPYPGDSYTQVLVATSGGQELAGLAHMSEAYGRAVLGDAGATSLIAHELAHQWWGDLVTNRDWTHFWLNEGFATFMAAAYAEHARGRAAYQADVERWRTRVQKLRDDGRDRRLVFPDWNRPTADDRAVVYQKGALALHELRTLLGDSAFWTAVRAYTKTYAGQGVVSADLQRAFETSSGRDLRPFFDEWATLR